MKYVAIIKYVDDKEQIQAARPAHREYVSGLKACHKVFAGGPFLDDSGALIIYDTDSEAEAIDIIHADPFYKAGVFVSWELRPWQHVL